MQAGIAGGRAHVLACLLGMNGLRISAEVGSHIEHLGVIVGPGLASRGITRPMLTNEMLG